MLYPSINLLRSKADSSYTLVIMAAKRARDLIDGKPKLTKVESNKPVTIATNEIAEDLISYTREEKSDDEESCCACEACESCDGETAVEETVEEAAEAAADEQ